MGWESADIGVRGCTSGILGSVTQAASWPGAEMEQQTCLAKTQSCVRSLRSSHEAKSGKAVRSWGHLLGSWEVNELSFCNSNTAAWDGYLQT